MQQTFLNAYDAVRSGNAELRLRPWLYRIAHNASLNLLRQNGWTHEQLDEQIDGVETPPQALERNERLRAVLAAVRELPERQRDALVLRALEGRSYEEIAVELGVTGGAVRQLLNRARNSLRSGLGALVPHGVLLRLAAASGDGTAIDRTLQAGAGAGGVAGVAKLGTAIVVAGAVVGGAAHGIGGGTAPRRHAPAERTARAPAPASSPARDAAAVGSRTAPAVRDGRHPGGGSASSTSGPGGTGTRHSAGRRPNGSSGSSSTGEAQRGSRGDGQHSGGSDGSGGTRHDGTPGGGGGSDHGGSSSSPVSGGELLGTRSDGGGSGSGSSGSGGSDSAAATSTSGSSGTSGSSDGKLSGGSSSSRDGHSGDTTTPGSSDDGTSSVSGSR